MIKPLKVRGEVVCYYEVKLVSGEDRCVPVEEYLTQIEPYALITPYETYLFFRSLTLKACQLADKSKKAKCSHDVKSIDDWVKKLNNIYQIYK